MRLSYMAAGALLLLAPLLCACNMATTTAVDRDAAWRNLPDCTGDPNYGADLAAQRCRVYPKQRQPEPVPADMPGDPAKIRATNAKINPLIEDWVACLRAQAILLTLYPTAATVDNVADAVMTSCGAKEDKLFATLLVEIPSAAIEAKRRIEAEGRAGVVSDVVRLFQLNAIEQKALK